MGRTEDVPPAPAEPPGGADDRGELPTEFDHRPPGDRVEPSTRTDVLRKATLMPSSSLAGDERPPPSELGARSYAGYIIDGRYQIEDVVAEGGMGVVYRASHRIIDRTVAVKILRPDFAGDREVTERFLTEARAASSIGHPAIVDVFDFGELPDGATYLAMELVDGQPLSRLLKTREPVPVARVIRIGRRIAQGLAAAHAAGIVHRDLKPENLVLVAREDDPDFVKILDFGIAKVARSQNRLTRAGTIFGTPQYMSPEQGSGGEVDSRADIYSLGVILYEMTCGRLPFDAENPLGLVTQHMYSAVPLISEMSPPPQEVPPGLEAIILKCLSKRPEDRYASMERLVEDLDRLHDGELPLAVEDLANRDDDTLAGRDRFAKALTEQPSRRRGSALPTLVVLCVAAASAYAAFRVATRDGPATAASTPDPVRSAAPVPAANVRASRNVAIVIDPIDARVFRGDRDLGTMPVFVQVPIGEVVTVQVRREGFDAANVTLDGRDPKVIVRLKRTPGVEPAVPVPESPRLEEIDVSRMFETSDAGASADAAPAPTPAPPTKPPASFEAPAPPVVPPPPISSAATEGPASPTKPPLPPASSGSAPIAPPAQPADPVPVAPAP